MKKKKRCCAWDQNLRTSEKSKTETRLKNKTVKQEREMNTVRDLDLSSNIFDTEGFLFPCQGSDVLLSLSHQVWIQKRHELLLHFQDRAHLECCIPKILSHNHRGLRKLLWRLANSSKRSAIPFLETLLPLLFTLNPSGSWLLAAGLDYLMTEMNALKLLSGWFEVHADIRNWLLNLTNRPLPVRAIKHNVRPWFLLPLPSSSIPVQGVNKEDNLPQENRLRTREHPSLTMCPTVSSESNPLVSLPVTNTEDLSVSLTTIDNQNSLDRVAIIVPTASFKYRKATTLPKRVRFQDDYTFNSKRHHI